MWWAGDAVAVSGHLSSTQQTQQLSPPVQKCLCMWCHTHLVVGGAPRGLPQWVTVQEDYRCVSGW